MNIRRMHRTFAIAIAMIASTAFGQPAKLDASLVMFATQPNVASKIFADRLLAAASGEKAAGGERLAVLIRLRDSAINGESIAALRAVGATVGSQHGSVVTAQVPVTSLTALAAIDAVMMIELAGRMVPRLNVSVPATGASSLRTGTAPNWSGLTGKGVMVGIIDDGVDFRHRDFRKTDGTTRIVALWDQRRTGAAGTPPAGYDYGGECTPAMINAAINGDASACTQPSDGGHGTHVAGIAAGNGSATGGAQAAYRFVGMAPEAELLVANSIGAGGILDAIAWMKSKAAAAGKPLAINMSFGSYFGPRDGTSASEQAMSNAGAAGVILVGAAGNEGFAAIRGEAPIAQGGKVVFDLAVAEGTFNKLEAWYPGTDAYSITVKGPTCAATASVAATDQGQFDTPCGSVSVVNAGPFETNDDRQVMVRIDNGATPLVAGTWQVTFTGERVAKAGTPVSITTGEVASDMKIAKINGQDVGKPTTQILTDTASAKRVIAVGSYNTNYTWTDKDGFLTELGTSSGPVGDLSLFSSRGPRRMCSNPAKCPAVMKPEIIAPGSMIMAALASDSTAGSSSTERDLVHTAKGGTSMATPHVTGAVALLLQKSPSLTPEQAKQVLLGNTKKTSFTPAVPTYTGADVPANPNYEWGYGVLDVAKAANAISANPAPVVTAFEFYYQPDNRYFLTIDPNEATAIDNGGAGPGWSRTGFTFKANGTTGDAPTGAVPVCRFYGSVSPGPNSHFFTANAAECQALKDLQAATPATQKRWNYEGIAFRIAEPDAAKNCASGLIPVYRAYNNGFMRGIDSNHRFTTSLAEIQKMVAQGWANENVVFCSPQ